MTGSPMLFIGVGAAAVLLMVLLVVLAVWMIVHFHEVRELKDVSDRHRETKDSIDALKRLTMAAIDQRQRVEKDVVDLKVRVHDLDSRVKDLENL